MKKLIFMSILTIALVMPKDTEALPDAISDLVNTYSNRSMGIKKIILDALDTNGGKWRQLGPPIPSPEITEHDFIRTSYECEEVFCYYEGDISLEKRKVKDLNSLYEVVFSPKIRGRFPNCQEDLLVCTDSEIRFEAYTKLDAQCVRSEKRHVITKILRTGDTKYVAYEFSVAGRRISQEERDYWFQMFDYLGIENKTPSVKTSDYLFQLFGQG